MLNLLFGLRKFYLTRILYNSLVSYPAPSNLGIFWNFGFLAFLFLLVQIITGVLNDK